MNRLLTLSLALVAMAAAAGCSRQGPGWVDAERVAKGAETGREWLMNGRTFGQERHSPLKAIDASNVDKLGFAWEFRDFIVRGRSHRAMQSNPIMADGVLYFSGPWGEAYAVDARTGKVLWTYDPEPDGQAGRNACCGVENRGVAVWKGKVYVASLDGWLAALDAKTGKPAWRVDTITDRSMAYTITGAPHMAGDNVMIGNAGGEPGARGYVSAYDAASGKLSWRFWVVPGDPKKGPDENADVTMARKTWAADTRWEFGGGGTVWDDMAYDPELGLAYLATGNGSPHPRWLRSPGGGDNLFLASIVAVDAKTGKLKWHYQNTPGDSWDYASTQHMILADLPIGGKTRKVIMQAPKNGVFYVIDRATGKLLRADPFTPVNWMTHVDLATGRPQFTPQSDYSKEPQIIWPSVAGGHGWPPMSFDPSTGWVYLPVYDAPAKRFTAPRARLPGTANTQADVQFPPYDAPEDKAKLAGQPEPKFEGRLKAWDPVSGKAAWVSEKQPFLSGGVLTTASGLLFEGASDGLFSIYDSKTGKVLRRIPTGTAIQAAPITYELDGVQYVAVLAGAGGPQGSVWAPDVAAFHYQNFERLIVFKLDGGPVPLPAKAERPARQPTPAPIAADAATLAKGEKHFRNLCTRCHLVGGAFGTYPDLWNLSPDTLARFDAIVLKGEMRFAGMGDFSDILTPADTAAIKAFIVTDEIKRRAAGQQGESGRKLE